MMQPRLRFKQFIEDWVTVSLEDISDHISYGLTTRPEYIKKGIPLISAREIKHGYIDFENAPQISKESFDKLSQKAVPRKGDIFLSKTGTVGLVAYYDKDITSAITQNIAVIRICNDGYFDKCVLQYLKSPIFQKKAISKVNQSTIMDLQLGDIRELQITLPILHEQTKIASFLSAVDEKISQLTKKHELLSKYKKGVMQKIFNLDIRFKHEGNDYPDWEEKTLGDIGTFQTSSIDKLSKDNESKVFLINYMNVYRHENINNQSIQTYQIVTAKETQTQSCSLKKGDILFTPSSETPDDIGHSVVIFEDLKDAVYSYHLMRFRPKIKIGILYSHYFCNTQGVMSQLTKLATGATRFTLSVKSFSSIRVSLPCLEEQEKIANFLSVIDESVSNVKKQLDLTKQYKQGLLQQMFI